MSFTSKTYSCGSLGRVRRLDNLNHGQANWVNVPVPQAASNGIELLDVKTAPNNGDHVFAIGPAVGSLASTQFPGVAVSNNGGVTWNIPNGSYITAAVGTVDSGIPFQWNEIVVVGPQVYGVSGFSVIVGTVDTGTFHGAIAVSNDGGATYNNLQWYNNLLSAPNPTMADMDCTSVHFPNTNVGVVALNLPGLLTSYVIKTTDGGGTWLVLNGQNHLTTATTPNPPGTTLPIGPITGISILANQEHIIGVGQDFIVSTIPVSGGSPTAGVGPDSWENNFLTASGGGSPPVYAGFQPNLSIGWHLGTYQTPDESVIWVSGDSELGVHSISHGTSLWVVTPGPGWNPITSGAYSRRASHFYKYLFSPNTLNGFYNKSTATGNQVYWNPYGFSPSGEVLSDDLPGLDYTPTAIWTWYEDTPVLPCYTLTDCLDGSTIVTDTDLSLYIGQTITIAEQPGRCYVVTDGCAQGAPLTPVTFVANFANCNECAPPPPNPCACPPGTTQVTLPNGSLVCREDIVSLANGPVSPLGCQMEAALIGTSGCGAPNFCQQAVYNQLGVKIYQDIATRPWPITPFVDPSCLSNNFYFKDNSASPVNTTSNAINSLWGDGLSTLNGRHNNVAVWNRFWNPSPPCSGNPLVGLYGFTYCLTVSTTTTYFFATSGRSFQLKINGTIVVENISGSDFGMDFFHIFPITLPSGQYIIEMNGAERGAGACNVVTFNTVGFAWEIYSGPGLTAASLAAMTTPVQLAAVTIYSTLNEVGNVFDHGSILYNYRCPQQGQALDNCFANSLNPNANPQIYVCHSYIDTPIQECCYLLTDCTNSAITYITSTNLSAFVGEVITVQEYVGCFIVSQVPCGPVLEPTVTFIQSYGPETSGGCAACAPKCYILTDCDDILPSIIVNDDLSLFVGQIINIPGSNTCWQVSLSSSCQGSISVGNPTAAFATCLECRPVCYLLVNCKDPNDYKITSTDLSLYVGQVIYIEGCPGICWQVNTSLDCTGAIPVVFQQAFADCETCSPTPPPPPLELRIRSVKPGYTTPGCDPAYTEKVSCNFGSAVYDQMVILRYGITMCCNLPVDKWDIKMQLLQLAAIYDPELCKDAFEKCCAPCGMVAKLTVYYPVLPLCPAPTNMEAVLTVPPVQCPAPTNMQGAIILNPTPPCICYLIIPEPGAPCNFDYVNCDGVPMIEIVAGPTYLCSSVPPTTKCVTNYTIQTTPANCLNGECHP